MAMAEDHAAKLAEPSEAPRLGALFAAGRLDGNHQDKLLALQVAPSTLSSLGPMMRHDAAGTRLSAMCRCLLRFVRASNA